MVARTAGKRRGVQRLILATVFAVMVFISKLILPTPLDKMLVVFQALFLGLGSILIWPLGATIVSVISGLLTSAWRAPFAPFTLGFSILYGILMDAFLLLFRVRTDETFPMKRFVAAIAAATAVTGMASYYTTVHLLSLLPRNIALEASIMVAGLLNGIVGGYLAGLLWLKAVRHLVS